MEALRAEWNEVDERLRERHFGELSAGTSTSYTPLSMLTPAFSTRVSGSYKMIYQIDIDRSDIQPESSTPL